jgi:hypothetical protein
LHIPLLSENGVRLAEIILIAKLAESNIRWRRQLRNDEITKRIAVDGIAECRELAREIKSAIDAGQLKAAGLVLAEAKQALGTPASTAELEVALTLALEEATIAQYGGDFNRAWELAAEAVEFADSHFGPRGIHVGRARLRRNFAVEAKREFSKALRSNLELADELARIPGSDALRLNCLTRAIACAVKNADRAHLQVAGIRADPIWQTLNKRRDHAVSRWFLFWCAVASLRQNRVEDASRLITYAGGLGEEHWRWRNAALFVQGHILILHESTASRGIELLESARSDARKRGFHGLVRSIDAGFAG